MFADKDLILDIENPGTWAVLSIASVLMVSIYALASVSGANFNPAVTLTLYLTKAETDLTKVGAYMATQIVAGICAGMTSLALFGDAIPLQPGKGHGVAGAAAVEILYTFVLCFVVLRGAVIAEKDNESFGMAIAFSVVGELSRSKTTCACLYGQIDNIINQLFRKFG